MTFDWHRRLGPMQAIGDKVARRVVRRLRHELAAHTSPDLFLRAPQLRAEDIFLASYPRSGNTWLRVILAGMVCDPSQLASLSDLNHLVPDVHVGIPRSSIAVVPRVIKTHLPYPNRHEADRSDLYKRVIYAVRHPCDVLVSYYDYQQKLGGFGTPATSFEDFVHRTLNYTDLFGSWQQHVLSWLSMRERIDLHLIRYEDLKANPQAKIGDLADFIGVSLSTERMDAILEQSSRARMVEFERRGSLVTPEYDFVRRENETRVPPDTLTPELRSLVLERCKEGLEACGYPTGGDA